MSDTPKTMEVGIYKTGGAHEIHKLHPGAIKNVTTVTLTVGGLRLRFTKQVDGTIEMFHRGPGRMTLMALGADQFILRPVADLIAEEE